MICSRSTLIGVLLIAAACAAAARVQVSIDREIRPYQQAPEMLWIPSGDVLKKLSLGHDGLLANIYWTRVVQYYGGRIRDHKTDFSLLAPLLDITVKLDPQLLIAYSFGAAFLSARPPRGPGQPEKAVELLQYAIENNPDYWRLWHELGFLYYWDLQDYEKASAAYLEGSKNPNARPWMKVMAAVIAQKGNNRETSRFLWTEIYHSAQDELIRRNALQHLESLRALDDIEELELRAAQFRERTGRWPQSLREMFAAGLLQGIPADPTGLPYQLQPEGQFTLHPDSEVKLDYGPSPPPPA
ncbi:MAG TPA: hypothetical protein VJ417_06095 [Candidatus Glassbacteria bacterium]|nr:hypothetical protein [Candidatus Glassbacteria bacterium]